MFHILADSTLLPITQSVAFLVGGVHGSQQHGALPLSPCLDRRPWESPNKQRAVASSSERGGGDRSVDLLAISGCVSSCLPSPKPFKGGLVYRLCREELGPAASHPTPSAFLSPIHLTRSPSCLQPSALHPACTSSLKTFRPNQYSSMRRNTLPWRGS